MDYQTATLGEIATEIPGATQVFRRHKLDFCCSGNRTLKQALENNTLKPETVIQEITKIIPAKKEFGPANLNNASLIDYILVNFHEKHKRDLPELIFLAQKVEAVHKDKEYCPIGLASHLTKLSAELHDHMQKEEMVLFPAIKDNMKSMIQTPISVLKEEHLEHGKALAKLEKLIFDFYVPEGACNTWRALILGTKAFTVDITEHIHLENNVLFPNVLQGR